MHFWARQMGNYGNKLTNLELRLEKKLWICKTNLVSFMTKMLTFCLKTYNYKNVTTYYPNYLNYAEVTNSGSRTNQICKQNPIKHKLLWWYPGPRVPNEKTWRSLLVPMGILAPGSVHAWPSARAPNNISRISDPKLYFFDLKPHAKFQKPRTTPSGHFSFL